MRWLALVLTACSIHGEAELLNHCEGAECLPCESAAECVIAHNPCHETAVCGHVDDMLAVNQIGCDAAIEYDTPEPDRCACVADRCAAVDTDP